MHPLVGALRYFIFMTPLGATISFFTYSLVKELHIRR